MSSRETDSAAPDYRAQCRTIIEREEAKIVEFYAALRKGGIG
jgi:hypothetical protein